MIKPLKYNLLAVFLLLQTFWLQGQPAQPVKVDSVVIYCVGTPAQVTVEKTPLKYNKDFAMSFQQDDAHVDIYNTVYPLFEGNGTTGGLYYTDGCGNSITFKMTSDIYIFNSYNVDLLEPGPYHVPDYLTWPQLKELYKKGWGVANHGVSDPITGHADYDIQRTQSYARRKLGDSLYIKVFVQPNQGDAFAVPCENNNYNGFLGQGMADGLNNDGNGVDVDDSSVDWLAMNKINREFDGSGYKNKADQLYELSKQGAHRWLPWGWHTNFTPAFVSELGQIYYAYGELGLDNIWVAPDEEILDYLAVKQAVTVNQEIYSNKIKLTFSGDVPSDRRFYAMTLKLKADKYIYDIKVYGTDDYSYGWIFTDSALINLSWDGRYYYPPEYLADSFATIAVLTQNQYDALVAMDYVLQMDCGKEKDSLRDLLCQIDHQSWNPSYDEGFCDKISFTLGNDTTVLKGECLTLNAPDGDYHYLWNNGDTTSSVEVCALSDTTVWLKVMDKLGFCSTDSMLISVYNFSFTLGNDTTICQGACIDLTGPEGMADYQWMANGEVFDTEPDVTVCPQDTTQYILVVTDDSGFSTSDTLVVNTWPVPGCVLKPDTILNYGDCDSIIAPEGFVQYQWYENGLEYAFQKDIEVCPLDTTVYLLVATTEEGCEAMDSVVYNVVRLDFDLGNDTAICLGDSIILTGPPECIIYRWFENDTSQLIGTDSVITVKPVDTTDYILYAQNAVGAYHYDTIQIAVNNPPVFEMSYEPGCQGESVRLVAVPFDEFPYYIWNYNDTTDTTSFGIKVFIPEMPQFVNLQVIDEHGCTGNDSIFVDVLPPPTLIAPNDTSVCIFDTVRLTASGDGTIWWEDLNGNVLSTDNLLEAGIISDTAFVVKDTSEFGCYAGDTVSVTKLDLPDVEIIPGDTSVCENSELLLNGNGAEQYYWYYNASVTESDTFLLKVTDTSVIYLQGISIDGCRNIDSVHVVMKPAPQVMAWGLLPAYCENDLPDTLYGMPEGGIFSGDGMVLNVFKPGLAGEGDHEILYTYENEAHCKGYDTLVTEVYGAGSEIDLGPADTLTPGDTIVLDAGEGFDSYFWNTGDTTQQITVAYGDYPVKVKHFSVVGIINQCSSTGSVDIYFINPAGMAEMNRSDIQVYPNPSSGRFTLHCSSLQGKTVLNLYSVQGKKVAARQLREHQGDMGIILDYQKLPDGIYFLELQNNSESRMTKILIAR